MLFDLPMSESSLPDFSCFTTLRNISSFFCILICIMTFLPACINLCNALYLCSQGLFDCISNKGESSGN